MLHANDIGTARDTNGGSRTAGVMSDMTLPAIPSGNGGGGSSSTALEGDCSDRGRDRDASPDALSDSSSTNRASARYSMSG